MCSGWPSCITGQAAVSKLHQEAIQAEAQARFPGAFVAKSGLELNL